MDSISEFWPANERMFRTLMMLPRHPPRSTRVTSDERKRTLAGDTLLDDAAHGRQSSSGRASHSIPAPSPVVRIMRAVTIDRRVECVWKWLSQMMRGGGMYGWPELETSRCRSADRLLDDIPDPRVGDHVGECLELSCVAPGREVVWRNRRPLDLRGITITGMVLDYRLEPADSHGTRLLVREQCTIGQRSRRLLQYAAHTIDFLLPAHQLRTIKHYAERENTDEPPPCMRLRESTNEPARYQAIRFVPSVVRNVG